MEALDSLPTEQRADFEDIAGKNPGEALVYLRGNEKAAKQANEKAQAELKAAKVSIEQYEKNYIKKLAKDASPKDKQAFYQAIGAPADAKGYESDALKGLDPKSADALREVASNVGLTSEQIDALAVHIGKRNDEAKSEVELAIANQEKAMQEAWGGDYAKNHERIRSFIAEGVENGLQLKSSVDESVGVITRNIDIANMFLQMAERFRSGDNVSSWDGQTDARPQSTYDMIRNTMK